MQNPLVSSFEKLEAAVRENPREELFPELYKARLKAMTDPEDDYSEPKSSVETCRTDKIKALTILNKWKMSARMSKKKDAEKDCDFVIWFINQICP
jgi:hypothetical protein